MRNMERFTPDEIKRMVGSGMRRGDIAQFFSLSVPSVRKYMRLMGVEGKQPGGRKPLVPLGTSGRSNDGGRA